jgi:NADPH-dependent 2,4-dienoyl-CoA reductase/sulfur reductase-like enzyme
MRGQDGPITIIGAEPHPPYDRPPLSKQVLTGKADTKDLFFPVEADLEAEWLLGTAATGLDLDQKRVRVGHGDEVPFDLLVVATGAEPRALPGAARGPGVHYLRTIDDAVALRGDLAEAERVVVIGAGFIGLEVAASARQRGVEVTVIEVLPVPLERAIGPEMGAAIAGTHGRRGVEVLLGTAFDGLVGASRVEAVRLAGGGLIPADLVVVGIGVAPATAWLDGSGVEVSDGILCDSRLRVRAGGRWRPDVVAAGDVARWMHPGYGEAVRIEHWTNAAEQGEAAAGTLLEGEAAPVFSPVPYFWSDQYGNMIQFVGEARPGDVVKVLEGDPADDRFLAAYGRDGRLVAALGMRRPARVMALKQLIADGAPFPPPQP